MVSSSENLTSSPAPYVFETRTGVTLRGDAWGNVNQHPVILLHGGGQTRHAWGGTARALAEAGWYALSLDARGHGDSDWCSDGQYSLDHFVSDLQQVVESLVTKPVVVGASLGGMTGLLTEAGLGPGFLSELVLVDITPRTEPEGVKRIIDFMQSRPEGFASLEEAADAVAGYLPHRQRPRSATGLERNLRRGADGRFRWHWDPKILGLGNLGRPHKDHVEMEPLTEAASRLTIPTLLVRGRLSDIVSEEGVKDFLRRVPHADYVDVSEAGHMVAGDSNDAFTSAVLKFLGRSRG